MLDWEGNMQQKKDCQHRIVLDDVEDDLIVVASLQITQLEQEVIDAQLVEDEEHYEGMILMTILRVFLAQLDPYPTLLWTMI